VAREIRALWLTLAVSTLLVGACKQKSKEEAEPAALPSASAAPAETAPATPPPPDTIPPPTQPPPAAAAAAKSGGGGESIKACCAALHKEESTVAAAQKQAYTQTATACDAISQLVAKGVTKKAAALTQLRASLRGGKLPAGCE
jgi:hypothetical protein